jgi:hypothetical protein
MYLRKKVFFMGIFKHISLYFIGTTTFSNAKFLAKMNSIYRIIVIL